MLKKALFIAAIVAASMITFVSTAIISGPHETLKAASEPSPDPTYELLKTRIEQLESMLAEQDDQDQESTDQTASLQPLEQHLASIAESLIMIAENSAELQSLSESMKVVVERLAGIEQELAWYRLDREEESTGDADQEQ